MPADFRPILGGNVPPSRVVGRDAVITKLWRLLADQSVLLVAERRIGKTSILRKMAAEPRAGWRRPIYIPLEGKRSPVAFVAALVERVTAASAKPTERLFGRALAFFHEVLAGEKVFDWSMPQLENHWRRLLPKVLEDIADSEGDKVLLMLDEFPIMLSNIRRNCSGEAAMELLDMLRALRLDDTTGRLRWIFTGSIGLHLVLAELGKHGYSNDPTNDMATESLGGLALADARALALSGLRALARDGDLRLGGPDDVAVLAHSIAQAADGLPYYINYLVDRLSSMTQPVTVGGLDRALHSLLLAPDDPAHLRHYSERIDVYYGFDPSAQAIARALLDALSHAPEGLSEATLENALAAQMTSPPRALLQRVLESLLQDHYLVRADPFERPRQYAFKYGLIRRWWLENRAAP